MNAERPKETDTAMVTFDRVSKNFGDLRAVDNVSLTVRRGEFLTLLGPSGCGKTTLLNLVAGFLEPTSGQVLIAGKRVNDVPPHLRAMGMVFQSYALFPHMNVADNVAFGLKMRRLARGEIQRRVTAALDLVRLGDLGDRKPYQLSGGQQQRVALARALVIDPDVLLLDEPLSALDKNLRAQMQIEIKEIQRRVGVTTIFVTHDQGEALSMSDRIVVLSQGVIQQVATPQEMYRRPSTGFVASFIGETNRLQGAVVGASGASAQIRLKSGLRCEVPLHGAAPPGDGRAVAVYLRPEAVSLRRADDANNAAVVRTIVFQGAYADLIVEGGGYDELRVRIPAFSEGDFIVGQTVTPQPDWSLAYLFAE